MSKVSLCATLKVAWLLNYNKLKFEQDKNAHVQTSFRESKTFDVSRGKCATEVKVFI